MFQYKTISYFHRCDQGRKFSVIPEVRSIVKTQFFHYFLIFMEVNAFIYRLSHIHNSIKNVTRQSFTAQMSTKLRAHIYINDPVFLNVRNMYQDLRRGNRRYSFFPKKIVSFFPFYHSLDDTKMGMIDQNSKEMLILFLNKFKLVFLLLQKKTLRHSTSDCF